jgi:hypothetical protein
MPSSILSNSFNAALFSFSTKHIRPTRISQTSAEERRKKYSALPLFLKSHIYDWEFPIPGGKEFMEEWF